MKIDVLVVGGGASGLVAAIFAARAGARTAIIEHKDKIGKKILATGNGKCNYTNLVQTPECYRGSHPEFASFVLNEFNETDAIAFFRELGIMPKYKNGYVYPYSEQAASIVSVLAMELKRLNVTIVCNEHVSNIKRQKGCFMIQTSDHVYEAKNVILATGGCASKAHGSDGSGYELAKSFGHKIIKPMPALTQLLSNAKFCKMISGVRLEAKVSLYSDNQTVSMEEGEVLFTNYGISGIPVFQISRYAAESVDKKRNTSLVLDFYPEFSEFELLGHMMERFRFGCHKTTEEVLTGMINQKLAYVILQEAKLNPEAPSKHVNEDGMKRIVKLLKGFKLTITGCNTFENAQVSAGGVDTDEVHEATLESKLVKNLYITGELLDIDGTCGGYNLQWAWSTGAIAGRNVILP